MIDVIIDTLLDVAKLIPFLFLTFLLMEYFEHKLSDKSKKVVEKSGKFGPIIGSILGVFPQCGFSVSATNLYAARIISIGTLLSIYLSTSDEMLPILISHKVSASFIAYVLIIKVIIGMLCGLIIDLVFKKKKTPKHPEVCTEEHCDCEHGIFKSSFKHTLNITFFIILITFVLNTAVHYFGEEALGKIFLNNTIFGPFVTSLVGLIPNCASSVVLTELFVSGSINFGSLMAGLLTGSGVALLILFKVNKNLKENLYILGLLYILGVIFGIIIDILNIL